jgi:serine-type D-Ala-D-Ala carboxypeptidase
MKTQASPPTPETARSFGRFRTAFQVLEEAIAAKAFPGCAFGIFAGGEVVLEDALGRFTYADDAPQVKTDTVFDLASLTKVVATTAMAMLLHQRSDLDLDLPVGELLPGFVVGREPDDAATLVTVQHLLAHNSGLPGYVEFFRTATTPRDLMKACLSLKLEAEPGARAEYSDPGFILLGKALEVLTGDNLAKWTRREIFHRLEMSETGFLTGRVHEKQLFPPTEEDSGFRHRRIQGEVQDENAWVLRGVAGHAGLFSNVPDLLRFAAEILRAGGRQPETQPTCLFERATVDLFATRQPPEGSSRAIGWDTPSANSSSGKHFSAHSIGHLGYSGCSIWIDRDAGVAVVLLTNRTWPDRQSQLIKTVRPAFHDAIREAL